VNAADDVLVGYSVFSATTFASAAYSYRAATDPPSTLRAPFLLKAGEAKYDKRNGGSNRWGDYSNTQVEPTNDLDFWTIQEPKGDANGDGVLTVLDIFRQIGFLFAGGPPPVCSSDVNAGCLSQCERRLLPDQPHIRGWAAPDLNRQSARTAARRASRPPSPRSFRTTARRAQDREHPSRGLS
jgi:hypothetical protein